MKINRLILINMCSHPERPQNSTANRYLLQTKEKWKKKLKIPSSL